MSEEQGKKEVTVLYRNFTPEIASDIVKLNLSEEAEKMLYQYLTSGANSSGHWWTQLWIDKVQREEQFKIATRKIYAFKEHPKAAMKIYTNKYYCRILGLELTPKQMIKQEENDLKEYDFYIKLANEIIAEIDRQHLDPWRIKPDNP